MAKTIDIVVPVHRGEAETRACLDSVLASQAGLHAEIVVIDDASPEPAISAWLRSLADAGRITLRVNETNRGFVASVNDGMALHPERDVVLLNSDTEVAPGWLDRLAAHVRGDERVGTATPFSNNATICSYPRSVATNALPRGETTASLDAHFAGTNAGLSAPIPTAVGFCMYIARRCLDRVGPFDEARYGTGYGEEVDFCMRAARLGFRHVIAGDVFVRHVGEVSFRDTGSARRAQAQALVDSLYPEFQQGLAAFFARDPVTPLRRRVDLERLRRSPRPRLLFVTHAFGGGIKRHVDELIEAVDADCEVLVLQPNADSYVTLRWARGTEEMQLWFEKHREWGALVAVLKSLGIARVHLHHVHGLPQAVLSLPRELGCPHDVTLHDYFAVCPQYHLTAADGRYCGEPGGAACMRCEEALPAQWPLSIPQWRKAFEDFLGGAARVIAPSQDCATRIRRYFPQVEPVVRPHPQRPEARRPPFRVLVPGAISPEKGIDVLEACARDAKARALPLHFRVLGYVARPLPWWPELPLSLAGEYAEGTLAELIAVERGDAVFFPAQCPETFSYTLGTALASGLPIVATDLGALPERLAHAPRSRIVPWNAPAARFNDALLEAIGEPAHLPREPAAPPAVSMLDYRRDYLGRILDHTASPGTAVELHEAWLHDPREPTRQATLVQLFDDGFLCGRAPSRTLLRTKAAELEAQRTRFREAEASLAQERRRSAEALAAARAAEERAAAAEARTADIHRSTSWRLTGPLRALIHALRGRR